MSEKIGRRGAFWREIKRGVCSGRQWVVYKYSLQNKGKMVEVRVCGKSG